MRTTGSSTLAYGVNKTSHIIYAQPDMFLSSWDGLLRILIVGTLAYVALVFMVRISGKRTLSKLNAFDFLITVALGSTLATVLLSKDVPLLDGIAGFAVLIGAQYIITYLSVRSGRVKKLVKSSPRLLVYQGRLLEDAMRDERITVEELHSVIRGTGRTAIEDVGAIVLETDATLSVLDLAEAGKPAVLTSVQGISSARQENTSGSR